MSKSLSSMLILTKKISRQLWLVYVLVVFYAGLVSCHPQPVAGRDTARVVELWTKLDEFAREALYSEGKKKHENLVRFFELFPGDFATFHKIYGYQEEKIPYATRNYSYMLHFLLPELKEAIAADEYYNKMIGVGVGGFWEADDVGALSHHLWKLVPENVALSIKVLEKYEEKEIKSFWYFLYDGPHPEHPFNRKHYEELYPRVRDINLHIAEQLKQAYEQLLSEYDGHGQ